MRLNQRAQGTAKKRKVRIKDETVEYSLVRSARRRKTVGIRIEQGTLEVSAPTRATVKEIESILLRRGEWILGKLAAVESGPDPLGFVSGERLPYLGQEVSLEVQEGNARRPSARVEGDLLLARVPAGRGQEECSELAKTAVVAWYRAQAAEYLQASVERWLPVMGREETPRVIVREQRSRWGSCSADGTLRFSWRLAMLEPDLIDSVVVHELAHLEVMNHSPAFWEVVLRAMPDARERRKRLNEIGKRLPI